MSISPFAGQLEFAVPKSQPAGHKPVCKFGTRTLISTNPYFMESLSLQVTLPEVKTLEPMFSLFASNTKALLPDSPGTSAIYTFGVL